MPEPARLTLAVTGADAMRRVGGILASALPGADAPALLIALDGELGAGKSTLTSGFLSALGIAGPHRSPTYTLIEPYERAGRHISHLDLYRVADPRELETLALRDLLGPGAVLLVEWAARARRALGPRDLELQLEYAQDPATRKVTATAHTAAGARLLTTLRSSVDAEIVQLS